jgi:hypothetical protein
VSILRADAERDPGHGGGVVFRLLGCVCNATLNKTERSPFALMYSNRSDAWPGSRARAYTDRSRVPRITSRDVTRAHGNNNNNYNIKRQRVRYCKEQLLVFFFFIFDARKQNTRPSKRCWTTTRAHLKREKTRDRRRNRNAIYISSLSYARGTLRASN